MIVLITGASHTGKTTLAQKMLEKYRYPYLSIDHLKMGLIRSGNTYLTPEDDDALTDYLWPIVREIIKTAIENNQNLIVEGCYIPFDRRKDLDDKYLDSIQFICLAMLDEYIESHIETIKEYASNIETRVDDSGCGINSLKEDNHCFIDGYTKCKEAVTLITDHYEKTVEELLEKDFK
jgi:gluconate kinase